MRTTSRLEFRPNVIQTTRVRVIHQGHVKTIGAIAGGMVTICVKSVVIGRSPNDPRNPPTPSHRDTRRPGPGCGLLHSAGDALKIAIPIQAGKKHCRWCHHDKPVDHITDGVIRWCSLFATRLETDKRGALRNQKCKEAEVD